jgi:hypothetical protein
MIRFLLEYGAKPLLCENLFVTAALSLFSTQMGTGQSSEFQSIAMEILKLLVAHKCDIHGSPIGALSAFMVALHYR